MKTNAKHNSRPGRILHVGIDVGSTTTKIAVIDSETKEVLYSDYQRHHAEQLRSVRKALLKFNEEFPDEKIRVVLTGSGAKPIADAVSVPFVQEVVGNSIALKREYGSYKAADNSTVINCSERYVLEIPDKEYPLRQHGQVIWKTRYRDPYPEE